VQQLKTDVTATTTGGATVRKLFVLLVLATTVLVAAGASTASAAPIDSRFHTTFGDSNPDADVCGIAGSSVSNGVLNVQSFADGSSWAEIHFTFVFTAAATGKSIEISGSDRNGGTATDNGDGTITFVSTFKGMPQKLSIVQGPPLSRDAGNVTFIETFDNATGDLLSQVISPNHGPHPSIEDPSRFCDLLVPALS
jgi:hypothetical protein